MASELLVNKITPESGTTLTLGETGDTISFASGVLPSLESLTITGDLTVDTSTLKVDSTNNRVGVGTASPTVELDVTGEAKISGDLTVDTNTLYVDSANNSVGIGTSSPANKLHVQNASGGSGGYLKVTDAVHGGDVRFGMADGVNNDAVAGTFTNNNFIFYTNNTERMRITDSGTLGIKTSTPDTTVDLDIQGNMQVGDTGTLQMLVKKAVADDYNWGSDGTAVNNRAFSLISDQGSLVQALYFGDATAGTSAIFSISSGTGGTFANRFRIDCDGDVSIAGALSKGSGSFKIDHPLESKKDTHYLVHSFMESPQADNVYRGQVELVNGKASVNIDESAGMTEGTFITLNRDVQCFTSNESGWTAVRGSVSGNILTITAQDETCTDTISWLVIGERQDQHMYDTRWTDENGKVIVEPLKPVEEEALENA